MDEKTQYRQEIYLSLHSISDRVEFIRSQNTLARIVDKLREVDMEEDEE